MYLLTSPSLGKLPNVIGLGGGALEGGRPPVAEGTGMGEGDCAGEGMRWLLLLPGIGIGADTEGCGVLCATAGESLYPN